MKKTVILVILLLWGITLEAQKKALPLNGSIDVVLEDFNLVSSGIQTSLFFTVNKSTLIKTKAIEIPSFWESIYFHFTFWLILIILTISYFKYKKNRAIQNKKELEKLIADKTKELIKENKEKDVLVQEVHHRVKNNLQLISSLVSMQISTVKNPDSKKILKDTYNRINSMTLVHEVLYTKDNMSYISLKTYLNDLIFNINEMVNLKNINIKFNKSFEDIKLNISDCIALGMIANESISNAIKYAFVGIENPKIDIILRRDTDFNQVTFIIRDNGTGIDSKFLKNANKSLGLRLIGIFAKQLNAEIEISNKKGTQILIQFNCRDNEDCNR